MNLQKTDLFQCGPETSAEHQGSLSDSWRPSGSRCRIAIGLSFTSSGYSEIVMNIHVCEIEHEMYILFIDVRLRVMRVPVEEEF